MTSFERFELENGLKVLVHEDKSTPMAVVNLLYNVGARDEQYEMTGFAHLFEHLMFEGSRSAPSFDEPMQRAGGENNAFTNNDLTNYYETLPAVNIETAFWLEADRMTALNINEESLNTQKKVVIEEFKENYLNQPYGDVWHILRELVYKQHPYQWPTIGKTIQHIELAELEDVQDFFDRYYQPNNAVLSVAGNVKPEYIKGLAEKWFGHIPAGMPMEKLIQQENPQTAARHLVVERDVPASSIYKVWHMTDRLDKDYYKYDFLTDIMSGGRSSRLYQKLVKEQQIFTVVDSYISGSMDMGMIVVNGRLASDVTLEQADEAIMRELKHLQSERISDFEIQKNKNKIESAYEFNQVSLMNRAFNLAYYELLGDAAMANEEKDHYLRITAAELQDLAQALFIEEKCSTLYYKSAENGEHD